MKIIDKPLMSRRTTLGLGGAALAEIRIQSPRDWDGLSRFLDLYGGLPFVLGKGSNVLASDDEQPVVLIRITDSQAIEIRSQKESGVRLQAGAGVGLPKLVAAMQRKGFSGLENLTGIPGSLGGACAMNAGSFGSEFIDSLSKIGLWSPRGGHRWLDAGSCLVGYRRFEPPVEEDFWVITDLELRLIPSNPEEILGHMREVLKRKKGSQPVTDRTCGCVFANPSPHEPAGRLLEESGQKGRRIGDMAWSKIHANFLVNLGQGTSSQACELIRQARKEVGKLFGCRLPLEVCLLGLQDLDIDPGPWGGVDVPE
ncbi:hypothetical protein AKJ60_00240 [candidate division MSBL1 archaeon SCGC-AAA385M11]|nr:hypothetical protein AKJ60_00240 [candidate division MSBL1 archaeon SCGC-AAA385M11]